MRTSQLFFRTILFFLFSIVSLHAQTVSTDYATQINSVFANLDKTKVPHKLLIDYAMEFAELSAYNGTLTTDNAVHRGTYTEIYNTLLMARVQTNVTGLVNPISFKTNWDNLRQKNIIVLSGLYYKYNQFKVNASPNYVTITNNKLYDKYINGVWQNPYDEKQVFAIAAPVLKYNSLTMQVQLPSSLWYSNQGSTVQSIAVDFNDGLGYQIIAINQLKTITYSQPGLKEWKYKLTLTNNQILYSHSKIEIDAEVPPINNTEIYKRTINQPCSVNAFGIDQVEFYGTRQYLGQANSATLEIDYAGTNGCGTIKKPLIVVEGFDSGLLGVESALGENEYRRFRQSTFYGGSLLGEISSYDIIYINWNNGKDYLQRNAYLLEDIIKWVNQQKTAAGSVTPNVVLGQSMGGVIARYALRDMENRAESHQTSLYISHDAPQQGANIPLSILYFARHLGDQFVSTPLGDMNINPNDGAPVTIDDIQTLLNAPGTKQLLINNVATNFTIDNNFATTWQTELQNLGYPQQTRNIALSNGNHCAIPQDFNPNDTLFSLNGYGKTSFLTSFLTELLGPLNAANDIAFVGLSVIFNEPGLLIGVLPGNSKFNMDFNAKALPATGLVSQIYKGKVTFTKKLFWLLNITVSLTDRSYDNPSGILSYDYYPGGKYPVPFDFANSSLKNIFFSYGISAQIADNFNFIPTPSALDIGNGIVVLNNADYFVKYNSSTPPIAPKSSPFVNFTTSYNTTGLNENHISFNTKNGDWLATELDNSLTNNDVFDCTYICSDNQITGSSLLCSSSNYSIPNGATVNNWTITQGANLVTLTGNGTPTVTLTPLTNVAGQVTLSLSMGDAGKCGNITLNKTIRVYTKTSIPIPSGNFSVPIVDCYSDGPVPITFYPSTAFYGDITYTPSLLPHPLQSQTKNITVKYTNPCTGAFTSKVLVFNYQAPNCLNALKTSATIYKVYPNPSTSTINVSLIDEVLKPITTKEIEAELYDLSGQPQQKVIVKDNSASINVEGLQKGIYILNIFIDGKTEGHHVIIE